MEVNLRTVESAVAFVNGIRQVKLFKRSLKTLCCSLPVLIASHTVVRSCGKLNKVLESEFLIYFVYKMNNADNFVRNLFAAHKDVSIVLSKAAYTKQTVQRTLKLMTVNQTKLAHAHGKVTVAVRLTAIHHNTAGAVHGLNAVNLVVNNGGIHIILIVIPVSACFPQMAVHNKRS